MRIRHPVPLILVLALAAPVTAAELYKWIDETGAVTYGDTPPKGAKDVRVVGKDSGSLTIVPGIPAEQRERLRQREEQQRIQRLEREVEELRAREQARANAPPDVVYEEVFIPAYGDYWLPPVRRAPPVAGSDRPPHGGKPRPEQPIAKPRPPDRTPPLEDLPGSSTPRNPTGTMRRL